MSTAVWMMKFPIVFFKHVPNHQPVMFFVTKNANKRPDTLIPTNSSDSSPLLDKPKRSSLERWDKIVFPGPKRWLSINRDPAGSTTGKLLEDDERNLREIVTYENQRETEGNIFGMGTSYDITVYT